MHWTLKERSKQRIGDLVALVEVNVGAPIAEVFEPLAAFGHGEWQLGDGLVAVGLIDNDVGDELPGLGGAA